MPDVFISYSKLDKAHADSLANDLKGQGLDVWWDADLYASQDYHDVIMQALSTCKVAIVLWSPSSIKSKWVRDEAELASEDGKLIPTYIPPFSRQNFPLGMGQIQAVDVNDRQGIYTALTKFALLKRAENKAPATLKPAIKPPATPKPPIDFSVNLVNVRSLHGYFLREPSRTTLTLLTQLEARLSNPKTKDDMAKIGALCSVIMDHVKAQRFDQGTVQVTRGALKGISLKAAFLARRL